MSHYNELYALVSEMDAGIADLVNARNQALSRPVKEPVPGDIGTVTVSGAGDLVSVDLDRDRLFGVTGASLGRAVADTIRAAEQRAAAQYRQLVDDARPVIEL